VRLAKQSTTKSRVMMAKNTTQALLLLVVCGGLISIQAQGQLPAGTKSGFVTTSDNVRIHYIEARPRSTGRVSTSAPAHASNRKNGPPSLLFVPGWMTPGWIWEQQMAHFAKKYRVVAMDPRSQGQSSKPADGHHPAARARDIKTVVDQLGLAPVVIVAATSAVTEAVSFIDQSGTGTLAGLVLVNGIAGREYDQETISGLLAYSNSFQIDRRKAADRFVRGLYKKPKSEAYIQKMVEATLRMPTNSAMALIMGGIASDNRAGLAKIDKPTLIVVAFVEPWMRFYEDLQQRIRGARMEVFKDAGHALFVDDADRFNTLLDGFLNTLPSD
jgi:non-heme chloroperoxidase